MHSLTFVWSADIDLKFFRCFVSIPGTFRLIFGLIRCTGEKPPDTGIASITLVYLTHGRLWNAWRKSLRISYDFLRPDIKKTCCSQESYVKCSRKCNHWNDPESTIHRTDDMNYRIVRYPQNQSLKLYCIRFRNSGILQKSRPLIAIPRLLMLLSIRWCQPPTRYREKVNLYNHRCRIFVRYISYNIL